MKKGFVLLFLLALGAGILTTEAVMSNDKEAAKTAIKKVIEASYINGAFNDLDTVTMRKGFHPTFAIHGVQEDGTLRKYPIDEWIADIEKRKASPDFDPADQKWDHEFVMIDVTGDAAIAKIDLHKDGKHIFTDYLSLLELEDGWIITDKVYHRHSH
jgi:ketosteroid isomerase-like protein